MAFDIYSTEELIGAYGVVESPKRFLLELFFPYTQTFGTEKVAFDKVERARRLAPFVSPNVAGRAVRQQGYQTKDFTPAYVKPKHIIDTTSPLKRMAGERLLGSMSPEERYNRAIMDLMSEQDKEITRREEWMAAQILLNGAVVVQGEDFPAMTVDFERPSTHTVVQTGTANAWGAAGVSILDQLKYWNTMIMDDSGYNANIVIVDPMAQKFLIKDPEIKEIMNNRVNTPINGNFKIGNLQLSGVNVGAVGEESKYLGEIGGFDIFVYQQLYTDAQGNTQKMLPPNTCIMASPGGVQGTRTYGAIRDAEAGFRPLERFPQMWREKDPSVTYLMTQSAPLPVLGWPEASFCATVA